MGVGDTTTAEIQDLVGYYRERFKLNIKTLSAIAVQDSDMDPARGQLVAENVIASMQRAYPDYAGNPSVILIGITSQDIYPREYNWQFAFGWRDDHAAVVSTARMSLHYAGEPVDQANIATRLRKMITKDLGIMVFEKQPSDDPRSVLYKNIGGIDDLDAVSEDF